MTFQLGDDQLTSEILVELAKNPNPPVSISAGAFERLDRYRGMVDQMLASPKTVYGINTGFGYLADVKIDDDKLDQLQVNLIRSHACGVGDLVSLEVVRACLILRAHTFLIGHSGITRETVNCIMQCLKHDILPAIPCQGSVGASGDLAPLAHLAMGLMGEGEAYYGPELMQASEAFKLAGVEVIKPNAKEGLSLINGTHFMTAIASYAVEEVKTLIYTADLATGLSLEAIRGTDAAFDERIQNIRGQVGQKAAAAHLRQLFPEPSEIMRSHGDCGKVQDPYSFRCAPQVHGASRDALTYTENIVNRELNAVTDNPLVFENGDIISGGNFHGQPIAMAMDFLGIAAAEIGNISERRIEKITNPSLSGGLPAFATNDVGMNSGYMIPHVVAAALVSENKIYSHPACVDSIPTSADKEDHVSMGPIAARKARIIAKNVKNVLAIEILAACQGLDLIGEYKSTKPLQALRENVRKLAPKMDVDRSLHVEIKKISAWIGDKGPLETVENAGVLIH